MNLILDTNAVIFLIHGRLAMQLPPTGNLAVSIISEIELRAKQSLPAAESFAIARFLSTTRILPLSEPIKECAIEVRAKFGLKVPDAIIAATAIHQGVPMVSGDRHFLRVAGLKVIVPAVN